MSRMCGGLIGVHFFSTGLYRRAAAQKNDLFNAFG